MKTVSSLQNRIERLEERVKAQAKELLGKDEEIADLREQLQIERGNTSLKQKCNFAQHRI